MTGPERWKVQRVPAQTRSSAHKMQMHCLWGFILEMTDRVTGIYQSLIQVIPNKTPPTKYFSNLK
jgi:hypothetical protein